MKHWMIANLLVAAACGAAPTPAPATPAIATVSAPAIELGEVTLFEHGAAMLRFHADGTTELGYRSGPLAMGPDGTASSSSLPVQFKPGPTIQPDGTVEFDGEARVRIGSDGTITDLRTDQPMPIAVTDTTVGHTGDPRRLELLPTGDLVIDTRTVGRIEGADTAGKRRVVLAFLGMMLMASSGPPHGEIGPVPAPAP